MFSVYGKAGRLFRGSMEELRRVMPTTASGRTRRIGATGMHEPELGALGNPQAGAGPASTAHRGAMAAYAQAAQNAPTRHPLSRVRDIMNTHAFTLQEDATVAQAWDQLAQRLLGQAPVVDGAGMLVGLLSRAELMRPERLPASGAHALVWQALMMQSVADLMWTPVPSVEPDTDIRRLARVLLDSGLPGLPVVDAEGRVTGFVSRTDILRAVVADPPLDLWS